MRRRGRRRERLLAVVGAVLVLSATACQRVPVTAGISTGGRFAREAPELQSLEFARLAQADARWVRLNLAWDLVQAAGPDAWDWSQFDGMVRRAEEQGLEVLAVPMWTPGWANGGRSDITPPDDPGWYGRFVAAASARYRSGGELGTHVRAWEIWNEPNHQPFWAGAPDAAGYVRLLQHAFLGIKSVDPKSIVISGGLAPGWDLAQWPDNPQHPINFVQAMYDAGARGFFDALGHHPYAGLPYSPITTIPGSDGWNAFGYTRRLFEIMSAHGDGYKQIWGTETGAATGTCYGCVSEQTQAQWFYEEYATWKTWTFAGPLLWHSARDEETGLDQRDANFGLLRSDFSDKAAMAFADALWRSFNETPR